MDKTTVGTCKVCNGKIIKETVSKYFGDPMHLIAGPGSRNQLTKISTLYCEDCGIQYAKLPEVKKDQ